MHKTRWLAFMIASFIFLVSISARAEDVDSGPPEDAVQEALEDEPQGTATDVPENWETSPGDPPRQPKGCTYASAALAPDHGMWLLVSAAFVAVVLTRRHRCS